MGWETYCCRFGLIVVQVRNLVGRGTFERGSCSSCRHGTMYERYFKSKLKVFMALLGVNPEALKKGPHRASSCGLGNFLFLRHASNFLHT